MRSLDEKVGAVRAVLGAARRLVDRRGEIADAVERTTGLTREGVERGFVRHAETEAEDAEILALIASLGDAPHVAVVLSANVFVASIRALALAVATAPRVIVRPSRREPHVARMLVSLLASPAVEVADELDLRRLPAGELHLYGRDETVRKVRADLPDRVLLRAHGAGFGVAFVSGSAVCREAALLVTDDVVAFDQRGCLSPRIVFVEGDAARAEELCAALDFALTSAERDVPRGLLTPEEQADARSYIDLMTVAGDVWRGKAHAVACSEQGAPLLLPPPGRHVHVVPVPGPDAAQALIAPLSRGVVAASTDAPLRFASAIPSHARVSALGLMQRPRFDGPVDRRRGD